MTDPKEPTGDTLDADFLKRIARQERANRLLSGNGYAVRRTAQGTFIEFTRPTRKGQPNRD